MKNKTELSAGIILGIGLGGFVDGIILHQILQTHNMLSGKIFPDTLVKAEVNMFWDGIFHLFTWMMTVIGVFRLWKVMSKTPEFYSGKILTGSLLLGWGLFNVVEGTLNHHIIGLHHVVERAKGAQQVLYDIAFTVSSLLLIFVGRALIKQEKVTNIKR